MRTETQSTVQGDEAGCNAKDAAGSDAFHTERSVTAELGSAPPTVSMLLQSTMTQGMEPKG
jgi:hypothetical protein